MSRAERLIGTEECTFDGELDDCKKRGASLAQDCSEATEDMSEYREEDK
jgi:hypothetical protein